MAGSWGFRGGRLVFVGWAGMMWSMIVLEVHRFARLDRPPDILVLHAGWNDLGVRSIRELFRAVKFDFLRLRVAFPDMLVLWSDIVAWTT